MTLAPDDGLDLDRLAARGVLELDLVPGGGDKHETSGPAPGTPSPSAHGPPDQIGTRDRVAGGPLDEHQAADGRDRREPDAGAANGLHGSAQPVVSSPKTSGTCTLSARQALGVVVVDDDAQVLADEARRSQQASEPAAAERLVALEARARCGRA